MILSKRVLQRVTPFTRGTLRFFATSLINTRRDNRLFQRTRARRGVFLKTFLRQYKLQLDRQLYFLLQTKRSINFQLKAQLQFQFQYLYERDTKSTNNGTNVIGKCFLQRIGTIFNVPTKIVHNMRCAPTTTNLTLNILTITRLFRGNLMINGRRRVTPLTRRQNRLFKDFRTPTIMITRNVQLLGFNGDNVNRRRRIIPNLRRLFRHIRRLTRLFLGVNMTLTMTRVFSTIRLNFNARNLGTRTFDPINNVGSRHTTKSATLTCLNRLVRRRNPTNKLKRTLSIRPLNTTLNISRGEVQGVKYGNKFTSTLQNMRRNFSQHNLSTNNGYVFTRLRHSFHPTFLLKLFNSKQRNKFNVLRRTILGSSLTFATNKGTNNGNLRIFYFRPYKGLLRNNRIRLFRLIRRRRATIQIRTTSSNDNRPRLITTKRVPPILTFVDGNAILCTGTQRKRINAIRRNRAINALLHSNFDRTLVFAIVLNDLILNTKFFRINTSFTISLLGVPSKYFRFNDKFILGLFHHFTNVRNLHRRRHILLTRFFPLYDRFNSTLVRAIRFFRHHVPLTNRLVRLLTLTLILTITNRGFLLLTSRIKHTSQLVQHVQMKSRLLNGILFLLNRLTNRNTLIMRNLSLRIANIRLNTSTSSPRRSIYFLLIKYFRRTKRIRYRQLRGNIRRLLPTTPPNKIDSNRANVLTLTFRRRAIKGLSLRVHQDRYTIPLNDIQTRAITTRYPYRDVRCANLTLVIITTRRNRPNKQQHRYGNLSTFSIFNLWNRSLCERTSASP